MGEIIGITNIKILGHTYFYDEERKLVGFPKWYNKETNSLDYRVGHQIWIPVEDAEAIVQRVLEQEQKKKDYLRSFE